MEIIKKGITMTQSVKFHNAAGIVPFIVENGELKFLLIKSSLGWEFPKGHVEEGETRLQAAKRETKEETGLLIDKVFPYFQYTSSYFIKKDYSTGKKLEIPEPKTVAYFVAEAPSKDVELSFEHYSYDWFTAEEANKKLGFTSKREVLESVVSFLKAEAFSGVKLVLNSK